MYPGSRRKYRTRIKPPCPNTFCSKGEESHVVRFGRFPRIWDKSRIQRYLCRICKHSFSDSTGSPDFRQHKPYFNIELIKWFASCGSQRRAAIHFGFNSKTPARKFVLLGKEAMRLNELYRRSRVESFGPSSEMQFDEMESIEHTKMKPLSVPLVIDATTRKILGFEVCKMPSKGLLAHKSRKKYGFRADERNKAMQSLFERVSPLISPTAKIVSDSCPRYAAHVRKHFPSAQYRQVISRAGCISGQGELKKIGKDPLFMLNHTAAMIRANVNRMFRRTWCTTKKMVSLSYHLEIYALYHNTVLTAA